MEESSDEKQVSSSTETAGGFKKPVLIGKIGKLPKLLPTRAPTAKSKEVDAPESSTSETEPQDEKSDLKQPAPENTVSVPYKEPNWSGLPSDIEKPYKFEVLKNGSIIDTVDLMGQPYWIFGRLPNCDITMAHPTISRYHAVLQYKCEDTNEQEKGYYLYDMSSTHGTFLNKFRLKPRVYTRVKVGHVIRLGCSSRNYILTGPEEDSEEASELSVTELKNLRAERLLKMESEQEESRLKAEQDEEIRKKKEEERGVDWGMGEDADEETDLIENPYAQTNNEELYLDDPKKALRGFMEREGLDLEYDCKEQGMGQFLCRVNLPLDDERGRPIVAEVLHKGKKKEAVIQCALEACRILDRHGLLRQATHESRKRKTKNWEENDYYDSDDDIFLDRTGTVEKKREIRMKNKIPQQPETYQGLLEKENALKEDIAGIKKQLEVSKGSMMQRTNDNEDSLDSYMKELKQPKLDKEKVTQLKSTLNKLQQEYTNVSKLVSIARPAHLPPLVKEDKFGKQNLNTKGKLPIFGKRIKVKVQKPVITESVVDSDDEEMEVTKSPSQNFDAFEELENEFKAAIIPLSTPQVEALNGIWNSFKEINTREEITDLDITKITKQIDSMVGHSDPRFLVQLKKILREFKVSKRGDRRNFDRELLDVVEDMLAEQLKEIDEEKRSKRGNENPKQSRTAEQNTLHEAEKCLEEDPEKKRKKNQRRIQQRQEKMQIERLKGYEEDAEKEDYNMWVPPTGQTGDGRTSLNEKFGY